MSHSPVRNFVTSRLEGKLKEHAFERVRFLNASTLVGLSCLFFFGAIQIIKGNLFYGLFEFLLALLGVGNVGLLRVTGRYERSASLTLSLMMAAAVFFLITGGLYGTGVFWFFTLPVLSFFLKGKRRGLDWLITFALIEVAVVLLAVHGLFPLAYDWNTLGQLAASFTVVTLFTYIHEAAKERKTQLIAFHRDELVSILEGVETTKQTIEDEKARDEAILEGIGDAVFAIDTDGKIILFNRIAAHISGFSAGHAMGKQYEKVLRFVLENGEPGNDFIRLALSGKKATMDGRTQLITRRGASVPVADSAAPFFGRSGKVVGVVVVFRDVTHEREVDRAKTEFVSLASHQLRTPLTNIKWYAEMLLSGEAGRLKPEQRTFVDEMRASNERMVGLVNALLNVSRIDMESFAIEPEPANIIEIAESVIAEMKPLIAARRLKVKTAFDPKLPLVSTDRKLMWIILQNLISNAVAYSNRLGSIDVAIARRGRNFLITVKDTGMGIPAKQQDRIFTKLFRADNAREKVTDGTGLGLYMVKSIVEETKGKVWFDSKENRGSTFYVQMPLSGMHAKQGTRKLTARP